MSEPFKIPNGVKDVEAYKDYLAKEKEINEHPDRYLQTSDLSLRVDLCTTPHILRKQVAHLPDAEKDLIEKQMSVFRSLIGELSALKRRMYGTLEEGKGKGGLGPANHRKAEALELFGRMFKPAEVHKIITTEWGFDIGLDSVISFYKQNIDEINQLQERFKQDYSDVRLGHKKSRLVELEDIYNIRKTRYAVSESLADETQLLKIIDQIKRETEGDLVINGKTKVEVELSVKKQIANEYLKDFNITALIVTRVAARLGKNPLYVLARLQSSMYAKFTGFQKTDIS